MAYISVHFVHYTATKTEWEFLISSDFTLHPNEGIEATFGFLFTSPRNEEGSSYVFPFAPRRNRVLKELHREWRFCLCIAHSERRIDVNDKLDFCTTSACVVL